MKPPIKKGPQGGKYQLYGRGGKQQRRILPKKKVQTGPEGGKFQKYKSGKKTKKRYLLHQDN